MLIFQHDINIKIINRIFYIIFLYHVWENEYVFCNYRAPQFGQGTFQVLSGHLAGDCHTGWHKYRHSQKTIGSKSHWDRNVEKNKAFLNFFFNRAT